MLKSILKNVFFAAIGVQGYATPVTHGQAHLGLVEVQFLDEGGNWRQYGVTQNLNPLVQQMMRDAVNTFGGRARAIDMQSGALIDNL